MSSSGIIKEMKKRNSFQELPSEILKLIYSFSDRKENIFPLISMRHYLALIKFTLKELEERTRITLQQKKFIHSLIEKEEEKRRASYSFSGLLSVFLRLSFEKDYLVTKIMGLMGWTKTTDLNETNNDFPDITNMLSILDNLAHSFQRDIRISPSQYYSYHVQLQLLNPFFLITTTVKFPPISLKEYEKKLHNKHILLKSLFRCIPPNKLKKNYYGDDEKREQEQEVEIFRPQYTASPHTTSPQFRILR